MSSIMLLTMLSVFAGFLCFGGAFLSFRLQKPKALVLALFIVAVVLITVIPVILAVSVSVSPR